MKILVAIFMLYAAFAYSLNVFSQDYIPMNFINGVWIEEFRHGFDEYGDSQLYCDGDTLLDNELYYKLYCLSIYYNSPAFYPDTIPPVLVGFIRENNLKQVFFKEIDGDDVKIIYDYNLELGDTIQIPDEPFIVNAIDSVEYCGRYHKRYIDRILEGHIPVTLTEGIGYSFGLLAYDGFIEGVEIYEKLKCYTEWNNDQCHDCDVLLKDKDEDFSISIYPNPTSGEIRILLTKPFKTIEVYDLSGFKAYAIQETTSSSSVLVRLDFNPPGIYIIKVWFYDRTLDYYKIIKI